MRLFIALDIDEEIRGRINRFVDGVRNFAPEARWMSPESMHVTLKFIGEQPEDALPSIKQSLMEVSATASDIHFQGYGFFPTPKSARVFWVGMEGGPGLPALASLIDEQTAAVGIPTEDRVFSPHLTLARSAGGSGAPHRNKHDGRSRTFQKLQERLAALPTPEFGTMRPHEFFLYQSQLSPRGSKYTKLASFALR
jgi:2'-5' RNA ligase